MTSFLDLPRFYKQIIAALADLLMLPVVFCFAIFLRYDTVGHDILAQYVWLIIATPLISIPIFIRLGLYRAVVRFIDQKIIYVVFFGATLSVFALVVLAAFATRMVGVSRGAIGIYWVGAMVYITASRFLARGYFMRFSSGKQAVRVAIYGAGQAGVQLVSAMRNVAHYIPVAFIDDKRELHGATIGGIKVYPPDQLPKLIKKREISEILLAFPSQGGHQKKILESLEPLKIRIKVTPPIESLINGELRLQDVRDIEIEDLLGRDPVAPDMQLISSCITGKSVLVTGAGGSIGAELCRQILPLKPARLVLLDMSEFALYSIRSELVRLATTIGAKVEITPFLGSVLEQERCSRILRTLMVDTIYHAAAYKHVPLVEHNPVEGIRNNAFGTLAMSRAAVAAGVRNFVLVSTDKAVRPTNVMGASKRLAELILQAFARKQGVTRFCMVRFGNVLGSSGSVVPLFRRQIQSGGPITVTHPEITRYFMTIPEAAQLVLQAGAMAEGGDVFVLDMGAPVKIVDLAKRMVHLSGLELKSAETPRGDVEIQYIGLRPGEKLYEELLIGANVQGTQHPLIMRADEADMAWDDLMELMADLDHACGNFDHRGVRALLVKAVSEYTPAEDIEDFLWKKDSGNIESPRVLLH